MSLLAPSKQDQTGGRQERRVPCHASSALSAPFCSHAFLFDANFNVTAAVDTSTDTVVERYSYTPYGEVTFLEDDFDYISGGTIDNQHLYTGRERDPETGLQLNRHRYYASHLGRWLTRDPIGYSGNKWNLYEYVEGNPAIYTDGYGDIRFPKPIPGVDADIIIILPPYPLPPIILPVPPNPPPPPPGPIWLPVGPPQQIPKQPPKQPPPPPPPIDPEDCRWV